MVHKQIFGLNSTKSSGTVLAAFSSRFAREVDIIIVVAVVVVVIIVVVDGIGLVWWWRPEQIWNGWRQTGDSYAVGQL